MKDTTGNKITEQEFTEDIGHGTESALELAKNNSNRLELEEMFDEYAGCYKAVDDCLKELTCPMCKEDKERMQEIIQEVTKQIQSELLDEVRRRAEIELYPSHDIALDKVSTLLENLKIK